MSAGILSPVPIFQGFGTNGQFLAGGLLYTYAAGTSTPVATYQDPGLTQPNTNPVVLNAMGQTPLWLTPGQAYKFLLTDSSGNPLPGYPVDQINGSGGYGGNFTPLLNNVFNIGSPTLQWANGYFGTAVYVNDAPVPSYPILVTETGVVNARYLYGNWLRYGADPTGIADSTVAINNALASSTLSHGPGGTYACSGPLNMISGQTVYGDGSATVVQFANAGVHNFVMQTLTSSVLRDLKIVVTGAPAAHVAGVYMGLSNECTVERVEMTGLQGFGVWIDCSNYCHIENNYFHGFGNGVVADYGDISIYCQSSTTAGAIGNKILNNICYGGNNEFGIAIEDPYNATSPTGFATHTLVMGNRVGPHTGYGILHYMPGSLTSPPPGCDTYNTIIGNDVQGITGAIASNPSAGAGIYSVGNGSGALIVSNNTVWNCCISTGNSSLAPAAIGINAVPAAVTRAVVTGNVINDMTQGDGIRVVSCPGGAVVSNNSINMPSTNNGTGPGGAGLIGNGITVENVTGSAVIGSSDIQVYGSGAAIGIIASGANCSNITIDGGNYTTGGTGGVVVATQSGGWNVNRLTISGANFIATGTADAVSLNAVVIGSIANCTINAASGRGLLLTGSTQVRVTGGSIQTSGSTAIATSGTCTSSFIDKSVYFGGASGSISNAGTGCIIEWYVATSTVPTTGTFALGDHAIPIHQTVASPKGWYTTVAGTPGTQTSEGNL
jgi:Pectate lyase superfamily protein